MYTYVPPTLTVDAVILAVANGQLSVLLLRRPSEPFKDMWALPGAYCSQDQRIESALRERVQRKVDINFVRLPYFEQLYTFDTDGRDPRGPTVSVAYLGITRPEDYESALTHAASSQFFPVHELPKLAFDHAEIVGVAVERLRSKLLYTDILKYAMPEQFTLTQLQQAYELILGRELDKRNFRKKLLSLDVVSPSLQKLSSGPHRPAQLYTFNSQALNEFTKAFV